MTDSEKMDLILSEIQGMRSEMREMKADIQEMKTDIRILQEDVENLKEELAHAKQNIVELDCKITAINLHLENGTDKGIQLVAENFIELTNKLNAAIPAADKNLAYEVKVNYLIIEVEKMKKEIVELKNRTA